MQEELTAEEVVTGLISSDEILPQAKHMYISTPKHNLGDFLAGIEKAEKITEKKSRYSFIKEGLWKI